MQYPVFIDDHIYMEMDSSIPETDQLRAMVTNLTRVHLLATSKFESFDSMIYEYLQCGVEVFGLETGIVSQVSLNGTYRVCDVISPLEVLHKDQEFPLEDTYCCEVVKSRQVIGFPQVGKIDAMSCHPVYQNLKLEAYLSAPIFVDEQLFGTLNFTSTTARERGFSQSERNLIVLMASAIGTYILLRDKENKLVALNQRLKQFIAYVAHDLRNPIGSIIGFSKLLQKKNCTAEKTQSAVASIQNSAETALEFVDTLLDITALNLGKFELHTASTSLKRIFDTAIDSTRYLSETRGTEILTPGTTDTNVYCDHKRIEQCLMNLLINALKYSPEHSTITLSSIINDNLCSIAIRNTITQTPSLEADIDAKAYGSVGFGLDIIHEVIRLHGSSFQTRKNNGQFEAEFTLPLAKK